MSPKRNVETATDAAPAPPGGRALRSSDRVTRSTSKDVKLHELPDTRKSQPKKLKEKNAESKGKGKKAAEGEISSAVEAEDPNNTVKKSQAKKLKEKNAESKGKGKKAAEGQISGAVEDPNNTVIKHCLKRASKVTEGPENSDVKNTSHTSQTSTLTMRNTSRLSQTLTLTIGKPSFKPTFRQPIEHFRHEKFMFMNRKRTFNPKIIFSYEYDARLPNGDVSRNSLAIIPFPQDPTVRIHNPMDSGFPIGNTNLTSVIRGLAFLIGNTFHRVCNPIARLLSDPSQQPPTSDNGEFVHYFMGYDALRNLYKIVRFLDIEGDVNGTQIDAFTIGEDVNWRPVVFCGNLVMVFEELVPNGGIHTLEFNHVHLVNQASHVHFLCNQVQLDDDDDDDDRIQCILSFELHDERARTNELPPNLVSGPILCCLENKLCCADRYGNTLRVYQLSGNNNWIRIIEVNTMVGVPLGVQSMYLPISLHRNKLLVAFHAMLYPPDDPDFSSHQHGLLVDIVTGEVELINSFRRMDWFLARSFIESFESLPY